MAVLGAYNFNDSTPAAPAGKQNVKWQGDSSDVRNISAYIPAPATLVMEIPAGTINGTNTHFTLSHTPSSAVLDLLNGVAQDTGVDVVISGVNLTYTVAPRVGDWHQAFYSY